MMKKTLLFFLAIFVYSGSFSQLNLNNGLVGYFNFNGTSDDLSPLNLDGTNYGCVSTIGIQNNSDSAFLFVASQQDHIDADTLDRNVTNVITISAWIKTTSTATQHIVGKYDWNSDAGVYIEVYQDKAIIAGRNGGGSFIYPGLGTTTVNDGQWHHVMGVVNGNTWELWVDCNLEATTTSTTPSPDITNNFPLGIGYYYYGSLTGDPRYFDGSIDEVRIYNRVLTTDEKSILCNINTALGNGVSGFVYNDISQDCSRASNEPGLDNRLAIINPGNIIVQTDNYGMWHLDSLSVGSYTITYDTSGNWMATCPTTANFTVTNPSIPTFVPGFGLVSTQPCAAPDISVNAPFLRRCFTDQKIYVHANNLPVATGAINNAYVEVELDPLFTVTSSSLPYTTIGANLYRVDLGNLNPGQFANFWLSTTISCNAILGQTLCMEANLYPTDSCVLDTIPTPGPSDFTPCSLPWDQSSISVDGWCQNDSIYFTITNTGDPVDGDMECYSPVRLYIDGQYIWLDSILLTGGTTDTLVFAGDGRTWRLEVDQHPLHPGNSHPNAVVELCGDTTNWTSGLVNTQPADDADPIVDIYCGVVTGSYDPNDKTGYPLGITNSHFILPNGKIDYVIRFQNTGTDTAFTIVVRDTLDMDMNVFSVHSGVSSHNYSFRICGPRVLEWTFNNIMLPDSTIDEEGSHGFVTFSVNQNNNLPDGTEINNTAAIYFDYNSPIITNTTSHIIQRNTQQPQWSEQDTISIETCDNSYILYGFTYLQTGSYWQVVEGGLYVDTLITLNLAMNNPDVSVTSSGAALFANQGNATYQWINCNEGNTPVSGAINQLFTPVNNGTYAVMITINGCTDTSACYNITGVGSLENNPDAHFVIYPNPSADQITLSYTGSNNPNELTITIYNAIGEIVYSDLFSNNINVSGFTKGFYSITILNKTRQVVNTSNFVKD